MNTRRRQSFEFATLCAALRFADALYDRPDVSGIEVKGLTVWWTETSTD